MRKGIILFVVVGGIFCTDVFADRISLKNGDRLTGSIIKSDKETLSMKSEFAGDVKVQWAGIEGISSSNPLHITLKDGQVVVDTVATAEGKIEVQTAETGKVTVSIDVWR